LGELGRKLSVEVVGAELSDELEVHAIMEQAGPLDLLLYAAGAIEPRTLRETGSDSWQRVMDANLTGAFYALKHARFNPGARVALLGAYPDYVRFPKFGVYAAAKAGLEALAAVARKELRRDKVEVTVVRLPAVDTDLWLPAGKPPRGALSPDDAARQILARLDSAGPLLEIGDQPAGARS
jgi:NAD(P)-dependent dehydrogenase (short-subunit alcohol dehydrogenase family)